jgi:hypothetical protein
MPAITLSMQARLDTLKALIVSLEATQVLLLEAGTTPENLAAIKDIESTIQSTKTAIDELTVQIRERIAMLKAQLP